MEQVIRNEEGVAIIKCSLTDGSGDGFALVDDDKWHELTQYKWEMGAGGYAFTRDEHNGTRVGSLHCYLLPKPEGSKLVVDHRNGVRYDDRLANLHLITQSANCHKKVKKTGTTSTHRGVSKSNDGFRWTASVTKDGKNISVSLPTEVQAAMAYNMIDKHMYGDMANPNPISAEDKLAHNDTVSSRVSARLAKADAMQSAVVPVPAQEPDGASQKAYYTGVSKAVNGRWTAFVSKAGNALFMTFKTEAMAAMAYNIMARHFYGDAVDFNKVSADDERLHGKNVSERVNAALERKAVAKRIAFGSAVAAEYEEDEAAVVPAVNGEASGSQQTKDFMGVNKVMDGVWVATISTKKQTLAECFKTEAQAAMEVQLPVRGREDGRHHGEVLGQRPGTSKELCHLLVGLHLDVVDFLQQISTSQVRLGVVQCQQLVPGLQSRLGLLQGWEVMECNVHDDKATSLPVLLGSSSDPGHSFSVALNSLAHVFAVKSGLHHDGPCRVVVAKVGHVKLLHPVRSLNRVGHLAPCGGGVSATHNLLNTQRPGDSQLICFTGYSI